jgi:hypothetical protein
MLANTPLDSTASPCVRFRHGRPRVTLSIKTKDPKGGAQRYVLRYNGRSLTLKQWSARSESGLSPSEIWCRLKLGFEVVEALGGKTAVSRALAFVSERERRAVRRQEKTLARNNRKIVRRRPRGRPPKSRSSALCKSATRKKKPLRSRSTAL